MNYVLIDSGHGKKLEQFGPYILERPCSQAVWKPILPEREWRPHASFSREQKTGWTMRTPIPESWIVDLGIQKMQIRPTEFGHVGLFPEQIGQWERIQSIVKRATKQPRVLNLFAYSGGSTLAAALAGAHVCHLDSSKGMCDWARANSALNGLEAHPIRWIVEDVTKFCAREERRAASYDGIILDPPSFGRGSKGEVFKIEEAIQLLLLQTIRLLSPQPLFVLFSCHTAGFTPRTMEYLMEDALGTGRPELRGSLVSGEMLLGEQTARPIPSGTYILWAAGVI